MNACAVCNAPPPLTLTRHGLRCSKCLLGELELYRGIVSDLAAKEPRMSVYNGGTYYQCACCDASDADQVLRWLDNTDPKEYRNRPEFKLPHGEFCPWRRSVELKL